MFISITTRRLLIYANIIAAVLITGINGWKYMAVFNPEIIGYSSGIRNIQHKSFQYNAMIDPLIKRTVINFDLDTRLAGFKPELTPCYPEKTYEDNSLENNEEPSAINKDSENIAGQKIILPVLNGIFHQKDSHGEKKYLAIMNGKSLSHKDTIQGFVIQGISDDGVTLAKNGMTWFIRTPGINFSIVPMSFSQSTEQIDDKDKNEEKTHKQILKDLEDQ